MEIWKDIAGYEGLYQISNYGNIRNSKGRLLKYYENHKGYYKVGLNKNGKNSKFRVHRLVAQMFIPNPHEYPQVNHIDGNKQNNNVTNLEWCTNTENQIHAVKMRKGIIEKIRK